MFKPIKKEQYWDWENRFRGVPVLRGSTVPDSIIQTADCFCRDSQLILITLETSFLMESIATREREEAMWNLNALPKGTIVTATAGRELRAFRTNPEYFNSICYQLRKL